VGMGVMDGWVVESGADCLVIEGWVRVDSGICDGSGLTCVAEWDDKTLVVETRRRNRLS
jgi:hypothetical protein